jgi:RNA polymerase sigma factor (TIGR02999 family)
MSDVTQLLSEIEHGDPGAAEQLLPLVYAELRKLAAAKMAREKPGQTLQATALVHEAYMRLVDVEKAKNWDSRGHFFAAAAEAMRRILVESAARKNSRKRGGDRNRLELDSSFCVTEDKADDVLAVDDALRLLSAEDAQSAELVKLRFFAGYLIAEAAEFLGISRSNAYRQWSYARAALQCLMPDRDQLEQ